jgi:hypothetical protein
MNQMSHFSPSLCNFFDVLKFALQDPSPLPVTPTLHVSAQIAINSSTGCSGNCCPVVMLPRFAFERRKQLIK